MISYEEMNNINAVISMVTSTVASLAYARQKG